MLAKALASQSNANFLNITMSAVTSKWVGEGEKFAKAVFTLATKIAPCVIFIDEVDSMLGKRDSHYEHEVRKIKNELMLMWDGLTTRQTDRVTVLAATNRPFDLDDAVLRRLPRRVLVDLPDLDQREAILKVILRDEDLSPNMDFRSLAVLLDGYSGSDIKNLCVASAYRPIRELLVSEEKKASKNKGGDDPQGSNVLENGRVRDAMSVVDANVGVDDGINVGPEMRPLTMADFEAAKEEVTASCQESQAAITELRKWNDIYGEGGKGGKNSLSYYM